MMSLMGGVNMKLSHDMCYQAMKAQDARFDGLFYTAVKTTGIYCRPICRVRAPKPENCHFYETAAQAEADGYRPCLRCRPELAPGYADVEQSTELVRMAVQFFEDHHYEPKLIGQASHALGVTPRHLGRVFQQTIGVSPQNYVMTKRLLMAKALLTDTDLSVTEIALNVGFGSVSRFNAAFKKSYHMPPSFLRKQKKKQEEQVIRVFLSYRPPYNWEQMMQFFKMRAIPGVEWVTDEGLYRRSLLEVALDGNVYSGWIEVKPLESSNRVQLTVSRSLEKVLLNIIKRVRRVFDLDAVPQMLPPSLPKGVRLPGAFDVFEMSTRAILGQQITVKAARTLAMRMTDSLGTLMDSPWPEIDKHFPTAHAIDHLDEPIESVLGPLGVIKTRSHAILSLAEALEKGEIQFNLGITPEALKKQLCHLKGIGPWTAEYLTMRALSWPDAFPVTDVGVKHGLLPFLKDADLLNPQLSKNQFERLYERSALAFAESYRPWRSYLTISLWQGGFNDVCKTEL